MDSCGSSGGLGGGLGDPDGPKDVPRPHFRSPKWTKGRPQSAQWTRNGAPKRDKMVKRLILGSLWISFLALSFWLAKKVLARRVFGLFLDLADPREPRFGLGKT